MKKTLAIILSILFISTVSFAKEMSLAQKKKEATKLVKKGIKYFLKVGPQKAYKAFRDKKGKFQKGEFYIFIFDFKGNMQMHGFKQQLDGKNLMKLQDTQGKFFVPLFIKAAKSKRGSGWVDYKWPNPVNKKIGSKSTYIKKVPGKNLFFGVGFYK